jgi:hypothetical protein
VLPPFLGVGRRKKSDCASVSRVPYLGGIGSVKRGVPIGAADQLLIVGGLMCGRKVYSLTGHIIHIPTVHATHDLCRKALFYVIQCDELGDVE